MGWETYLKELPQLVEQGLEGRWVAYCGKDQVGVANTMTTLVGSGGKLQELYHRECLFVTEVDSLDVNDSDAD